MDRSEGERRAARRPKDQPESEGSRASRSRRSVTGEKRGAPGAGEIRRGADRKTGEGPCALSGIFGGGLAYRPDREQAGA